MIQVTIDTNSINAKQRNSNLNQIEEWHEAGLVDVAVTSVMSRELRGEERRKKRASIRTVGGRFTIGRSALAGGDTLAGPNAGQWYASIAGILFSHAPFNELATNHRPDVEHLAIHKATNRDIFVTSDQDFLRNKERLDTELRITVASPQDAAALITSRLKDGKKAAEPP